MPITAIELIKKLMAKAGVTHATELTADIPDEVATALDNNLLTIAAATNNHPDVKKVYFAQAYNGLDAEINDLITEYGLPDEVVQEIKKAGMSSDKPGGASTKRAIMLTRKIKELGEKGAPADKEAAKKLNDTIVDLNKKLVAEIEKQTTLKTDYDNKLQHIKIQTKLNKDKGSYKTVYDDLDPDAKEAAINALIDKSLRDNDAEFKFDEKENIILVKKDGSNLFGENHTLITPKAFMDKTFSKILKVTDPNKDKTTPAAPLNGGGKNDGNPALSAALADSLKSYTDATKAVMV